MDAGYSEPSKYPIWDYSTTSLRILNIRQHGPGITPPTRIGRGNLLLRFSFHFFFFFSSPTPFSYSHPPPFRIFLLFLCLLLLFRYCLKPYLRKHAWVTNHIDDCRQKRGPMSFLINIDRSLPRLSIAPSFWWSMATACSDSLLSAAASSEKTSETSHVRACTNCVRAKAKCLKASSVDGAGMCER